MIPEAPVYKDRFDVVRDRVRIRGLGLLPKQQAMTAGAVVVATRPWGLGRPDSKAVAAITGDMARVLTDDQLVAFVRRDLVARIEDTGPPPREDH